MNGVIDENTLVWGQGLADWLPVKNVRTLVPQIRTVEGEMPHNCTNHVDALTVHASTGTYKLNAPFPHVWMQFKLLLG